MKRTWIIETTEQVGEEVKVSGWVHVRRDMGKLIFIELRDKTGLIQVVFLPNYAELLAQASSLRSEFVVSITGRVNARPEKQVKDDHPTGTVELEALSMEILSEAATPPFELTEDTSKIDENIRLKYRYLDIRTQRLQNNLEMRSKFVQSAREYLFENRFTEVETPLLTKSTPEGSRDFLVPSRHARGSFYALPQSPQQYKQLLVGGGVERYFQIARAIRDEDLRADRGYEHSQIDIEMAFVEQEDILSTVEAMMIQTVEAMGFTIKEKPFPRITYAESMEKYGADKFDLRTEEDKAAGVLAYAWVVDFPFFEKTENGGWTFSHNPFSMPKPEHVEWLMEGKNIDQIITQQYDLVCNGYEAGGGSIRAHKAEILRATYKIMGYSEAETEESVGHMLEAFSYGFPPHGGIALGIERNLMNLTGETFLREVQAFPMSSQGRTAVMDAPGQVSQQQLDELGLIIQKD
ncbi:MAG: aspartate--tRNA ligase [Candidatus Kerfeldbacteria bacterium CG15_BIG_FIL_POST_REV_8_21_14_020_45_12]|uniref:Aspartate--tRNA ligase n=1 Tax=Candidatus Kerfeldbacteria bacterium CG15_BIG_FIL_POST_REV_8_21_14_020_45_12 TaxID=2014247 RepID=A0A2M7H3U8_9BACT|nr:MAG: aspartate--tRNA ligase [Candidatus Kerfeldbacteria bacterium CG15_BIG_FIL_POST_REV_8_21_14_020_45_12]